MRQEGVRNILIDRPDLTADRLEKTRTTGMCRLPQSWAGRM
jgi:hypothetical protein